MWEKSVLLFENATLTFTTMNTFVIIENYEMCKISKKIPVLFNTETQ